jgi:hypothetical protein
MLEWQADAELELLIRRYYAGEASLWPQICQVIEAALAQQQCEPGAYHIRLKCVAEGYRVRIEAADAYANPL